MTDATPEIDDPGAILIAAFEGWNDAGNAASTAVLYLRDLWGAVEERVLDSEDYHDFQVNRPIVETTEDGRRVLTWPSTTISVCTSPQQHRKVIFVHGIEPSMRWRRYCGEIIAAAQELGVTTLVTVGALLADVPHTRPIPVSTTSDDPAVQALLDVEGSEYEGPTGIVGVLAEAASTAHIHALSVWAAVPHYVAHPPSPKATAALLTRLEQVIGEPIELGSLPEDAEAWQHGVNELASQDEEIAEYVRQLEEAKDTVELPEASGEAIAQEFERYLSRREARRPNPDHRTERASRVTGEPARPAAADTTTPSTDTSAPDSPQAENDDGPSETPTNDPPPESES